MYFIPITIIAPTAINIPIVLINFVIWFRNDSPISGASFGAVPVMSPGVIDKTSLGTNVMANKATSIIMTIFMAIFFFIAYPPYLFRFCFI